jgi:hypothetical protein
MKVQIVTIAGVAAVLIAAAVLWSRTRPNSNPAPAVSQPQVLDPKTILFSLPTLCDGLPPLESPVESVPNGALRLHEDDWRQIEFVSSQDREVVNRELAELREFKVANKVGPGWKNVYVRDSRPEAVRASKIALSRVLELARQAAPARLFLETQGRSAEVRGGFAIPLDDDVLLYGNAIDGKVVSLNLHLKAKDSLTPKVEAIAFAISRAFNLSVVDWYGARVLSAKQ